MLRFLCVCCSLAALTSYSRADDKASLQGSWQLVSVENDGKAGKVGTDDRLTIEGDVMTLRSSGVVKFAAAMTLDEKAKPKALDMAYTEGPSKGKTYLAIYSLDGDTLKFRRQDKPGDPRPKEFVSKPGEGGVNSVYKRVK